MVNEGERHSAFGASDVLPIIDFQLDKENIYPWLISNWYQKILVMLLCRGMAWVHGPVLDENAWNHSSHSSTSTVPLFWLSHALWSKMNYCGISKKPIPTFPSQTWSEWIGIVDGLCASNSLEKHLVQGQVHSLALQRAGVRGSLNSYYWPYQFRLAII